MAASGARTGSAASADTALDLLAALAREHGVDVHTSAARFLRSHLDQLRGESDGALAQLFEAEAGEESLREQRDRARADLANVWRSAEALADDLTREATADAESPTRHGHRTARTKRLIAGRLRTAIGVDPR